MNDIADFFERNLFTCYFKSATGMDCPGCGMQRAFVALLRGNLVESLQLNPSLIPFILTVVYTTCHLTIGFKNGARNIVWLFSITVAVMLVNFVVKIISHH